MLKVFWGKADKDGRTYHGDLAVFPDGRITAWEHKAGEIRNLFIIHSLVSVPEDLLSGINVIIIGQGHFKFLQASSELKRFLRTRGIMLKQARSPKAAAEFIRISNETACLLLLHTKC